MSNLFETATANYKNIKVLFSVLAIFVLAGALNAQTDGVDNTYLPLVNSSSSGGPMSESLQPDGKLIVTGSFTIVNGMVRPTMVRLNTDGSVDPTFTLNCPGCNFSISGTLVQADGKIIVAGWNPGKKMVRLNPDGSQDMSFGDPFAGLIAFGDQGALLLENAADGKFYANYWTSATFTWDRTVFRVNADGSRDTTFTPFGVGQWRNRQSFQGVDVLPDGRVFIFGKTSYGHLAQFNPDGSRNPAFEGPLLTYPNGGNTYDPPPAFINSFGFQSDGKVLFTGQFDTVNGLPKNWVARLNTDGGVDPTYNPPAFTSAGDKLIRIDPGDKGLFVRNDLAKKLLRLNSDGSVDNTYSAPDELTSVHRWYVLADGRLLVFGEYNGSFRYVRLNSDGSLDSSFAPPSFDTEGSVSKVLTQTDGKTVVWGTFARLNGTTRANFGRLNADGTLDTSFDPGSGFAGGDVIAMAQQSDGKMLACGTFTGYNGGSQARLVRINTNGSFDNTFNPAFSGSVQALKVRSDGKIVVGGAFQRVNSTARTAIALLNSDGTLDAAFNPTLGTATVYSLFVQGDGKVMVGGSFSGVNGFNRSNLVRLNADGSLDAAFNAGSPSSVTYISQVAGGKYLLLSNGLKRINSDGTTDSSFTVLPPTPISTVLPRPDGTILIGGSFTNINTVERKSIARLKPNGLLDVLFNPRSTNGTVSALAAQPDGKVIVGGSFTMVGSLGRTGVARLLVAPLAPVTPFDFNGDGRSDFMVTRPSDYNWHLLTNVTYNYTATAFGTTGDKVVPADYDGDGKTDIAIWRPSTGDWWYKGSATGNIALVHFGNNGDTVVPSDTDGNGKTDLVVVSPSGLWRAIAVTGELIVNYQFSSPGDKPVAGDFDGDGKSDLAYFRPSNGTWYYNKSSSGANLELGIVQWGLSTDIPAPADYDGDGKTDVAVYRPSEGNWYVLNSGGGYLMVHFGATGDKPIPADYDGDGKADVAVFRPSDGYWYQLLTTGGYTGLPWGISSDIPAPNALLPTVDPPRAISVSAPSVAAPAKTRSNPSLRTSRKHI